MRQWHKLTNTTQAGCSAVWLAHLVWDQRAEGSNPFTPTICQMVSVAQSVRASDCGPEGRGFDSHHSPHFGRSQLNWIERQTSDLQVMGSTPIGRATLFLCAHSSAGQSNGLLSRRPQVRILMGVPLIIVVRMW